MYTPISQLTRYSSNWSIKAKVIEKSFQMFSMNNDQLDRLMTMVLIDNNGDTVLAKCYDDAADKWNEVISEGKVYCITKASLIMSNKRFNMTSHPYEIKILIYSEITQVDEEIISNKSADNKIFTHQLTWTTLSQISSSTRDLPYICNFVAVIHDIGDKEISNTRTVEALSLRRIRVVEKGGLGLIVTLWGAIAEIEIWDKASMIGSVIGFENIQIKEFRGKVASTLKQTRIHTVLNVPRALELQKWAYRISEEVFLYLDEAKDIRRTEYNECFRTLEDGLQDLEALEVGVALNITVVACIFKWFHSKNGVLDIVYRACVKCKRKLVDEEHYARCDNCDSQVEVSYRYRTAVNLIDYTRGRCVATIFHEACQSILNYDAMKVGRWINGDNTYNVEADMKTLLDYKCVCEPYKFTLKMKKDIFNGRLKNDIVIINAEPLDAEARSSYLLKEIYPMLGMETPEHLLQRSKRSSSPMTSPNMVRKKQIKSDA